ncbi:hypothetical protein Hanom_Chr07g00633011 [Helianthus anomalus]
MFATRESNHMTKHSCTIVFLIDSKSNTFSDFTDVKSHNHYMRKHIYEEKRKDTANLIGFQRS